MAHLLAVVLLSVPVMQAAADDATGTETSPSAASQAGSQQVPQPDSPQPVSSRPVAHLDKTVCDAAALKDLAVRRQVAAPAPEQIEAGSYRLTRWPALSDDQLRADDEPMEFIEIDRGGDCQLLVADRFATFVSARLPLAGAKPPQLIISSYSGGAHCCFTYYAVSLGDAGIAADRLDTADSPIDLVGLGDGDVPDITYADMAFAYWNTAFADSPTGQVRLTWDKDRYRLADPQQAPAPSEIEQAAWQAAMTAAIRAMPGPYVPIAEQNNGKPGTAMDPVIWSHLLDLIYAGYPDLARDLFDRAWPDDVPGKGLFWRDFVTQLQQASVIWKPWHLATVLVPDLPARP